MPWHTRDSQTSMLRTWNSHGTSPPVNKHQSCMSLMMRVSGECRQRMKTLSTGCQSHRQTRSKHGHCQWRHQDSWWRHQTTPNSWYSSTQSVMNWYALICRTTWSHVTPLRQQLEHSSSVTSTPSWNSIKSVKLTLEVKCCVISAVHVYYHSATLQTSLST